MRLSCNLIINQGPGKDALFYQAGEPVPDADVPAHALEYRISEREGAKLYREILEWQALVAAKREKAKEEAQNDRKRVKARAGKG
jgi:hypothetical protein